MSEAESDVVEFTQGYIDAARERGTKETLIEMEQHCRLFIVAHTRDLRKSMGYVGYYSYRTAGGDYFTNRNNLQSDFPTDWRGFFGHGRGWAGTRLEEAARKSGGHK